MCIYLRCTTWCLVYTYLVKWSLELVRVAQSCLTLCNPMDCSLPGSSVHGILQARVLQWVAMPFSRGFSRPRDWTHVCCIAGRFFTIWATREAQNDHYIRLINRSTTSVLLPLCVCMCVCVCVCAVRFMIYSHKQITSMPHSIIKYHPLLWFFFL